MQNLQEYELVRVGLPVLKFKGAIIGEASLKQPYGDVNILTVRIYRTEKGRYIAEIQRYIDQDRPLFRNATVGSLPLEIVSWLKEGEDTLGQYSQAAVEMACQNDPEFRAAWVEVVE